MKLMNALLVASGILTLVAGSNASADEIKKDLTYACGGSSGYYCQGNGKGFAEGMKKAGGYSVTNMSTAGSFEINQAICSGKADAGGTQADAYALDRAADRAFAGCAQTLGVIGREVVLMAARTGASWSQFRQRNPASNDGKWIVRIKAGSGATAPARLISQYDPAIAENVIFEEVPKDIYNLNAILGDISFGDADAVMWVQKLNPLEGDMKTVNDYTGIDFVPTGFKQYVDKIMVGNRLKAPVYGMEELPVESNVPMGADLITGGGRKMSLLTVNVLGLASSKVHPTTKQHMVAVYGDQDVIAPASNLAEKIMRIYSKGMEAANAAWKAVD